MTGDSLNFPTHVVNKFDTERGPHGRPKELVTVVVTCYNQGRFLPESIGSLLSQTRRPDEILLVDDGSTDNTRDQVRRFPEVIYIRQDNSGLAAARNTGLRRSRGDLLVFLDADDRLVPQALEAGLDDFAAHPECAFVFGAFRRIDATGKPLAERAAMRPLGDGRLFGSSQEQPDLHACHRDVSQARARGRGRIRHLASRLRRLRSVSQDCSTLSRAPARKARGGI